MFYINLLGFSIDPLYFGYNSVEQETPIFVYFDVSGTFWNSNWLSIFLARIFLHEKQPEDKKYTSGPLEIKRSQVAWALGQATPPMLVWGSSLWCHLSLL
jgi:hypothetical protein